MSNAATAPAFLTTGCLHDPECPEPRVRRSLECAEHTECDACCERGVGVQFVAELNAHLCPSCTASELGPDTEPARCPVHGGCDCDC